jgi:hypothetical protein
MKTADATEKIDQVEKQFVELCNQHRDAMLSVLRLVVSATLSTEIHPENEAVGIRNTLAEIRAKEFVSAGEAAELFGCSAQHLRNLVQRAMDGKTAQPIPFRDLDGVITFPLAELIEWTKKPKPKAKQPGGKNNPHLKAVAS